MTLQPPAGRNDYLFDLTRWNRAGLSGFQYVDGDAAVWLEEERIALLGLYLRDIAPDDRTPEKWRDLRSDFRMFTFQKRTHRFWNDARRVGCVTFGDAAASFFLESDARGGCVTFLHKK